MNILILNGSPKGDNSITLQTCRYLERLHPEHSVQTLHVGQRIRAYAKDLTPVLEALDRAELVLLSYPVYTFLAPSQLHRLIELLKERRPALTGKYAAQITTSKHFYDVTAHEYIRENLQDLGLKYLGGLSADMEDLLTAQGQADARSFFDWICWRMARDDYEPIPAPQPEPTLYPVTVPASVPKQEGRVAVVTDLAPEDTRLAAMIACFRAVLPYETDVVNLRDFAFQGGCLGCFRCAADGVCVYKDGFADLLRERIQTARAIVTAFTIRDHSMGSLLKTYDDRQFCNGHRTVTMGTPMGYLVSGAYCRERNLQTLLEARAQVGGNFLCGVASDERDPDAEIDRMAARLAYAIEHGFTQPANFYGVGGRKIFRDLIWQMQGLMREDHRFFKAHGQYDFPQKRRGTMLKMYLVGALFSNPTLRAKAGGKINEGMLAPYQKVLAQLPGKETK